ncbi:iron permease FTR1 [Dothidotthia symphoricarpi CBS 119687]|uniref:Iron permease FTR1 n=1 Tax=Dothidotthia symphoricarpi CBS 119687 TaxID=1392245 RepID=A0A6A5ZZN2_9PLEO|nr:iron permease FTR1 [Dothidotthia symphoricarpi CBS 119687]KAF2124746.1 iron permease FTR1 [Dothidotthia symphoricarpi CBS 119687]
MPNVFAVSVFFICFRECLETSIIVSVLLAFLKQTLDPEQNAAAHKRLVRQIWWGVGLGALICLIICAAVIGTFYTAGKNVFEKAEYIWEGVFGILASIIITVMGAALLRVSKLQDKWRVKIAKTLEDKDSGLPVGGRVKRWMEKYAMFILPFVTVLREGIEAVLFIAGVGLGLPATSFPLAVICGLGAGALVGYLIYKGGNKTSLQIFLVISTCFLYLVAAGLFSKGVWNLEQNAWVKLAGEGAVEAGAGPGSYDIRKSVWHLSCCSPQDNGSGGWGIFNSLFGWQSSATYGSVISYNLYWVAVIIGFVFLGWKESKETAAHQAEVGSDSETSSGHEVLAGKKTSGEQIVVGTTAVREVK